MLVRFLKKHLDWKPGDEHEFGEELGVYLTRCGVAESADIDPVKTEAVLLEHLEKNKPVQNANEDLGLTKQADKPKKQKASK